MTKKIWQYDLYISELSESHSVVSDSLQPHGLYTIHGILQARILEYSPSPGDLHNPGIEPRSPTLQADSLPAEPPPKSIHIRQK